MIFRDSLDDMNEVTNNEQSKSQKIIIYLLPLRMSGCAHHVVIKIFQTIKKSSFKLFANISRIAFQTSFLLFLSLSLLRFSVVSDS